MYKIRMSLSQLLFRLARWVQPKQVSKIAKVEGALITLSESLTYAFGAGDEVVIKPVPPSKSVGTPLPFAEASPSRMRRKSD